jgi:uncharacterized protein YjbI with pentapeptide repeats
MVRLEFIKRAELVGANLERFDLRGAKFAGVNLTNANLRGADLTGADLRGACFVKSDLSRACLHKVNAEGADFTGSDLSMSYMRGANFKGASFFGSILRCAIVKQADFTDADLRMTNILNACIWWSLGDFRECLNYETAIFDMYRKADRTGALYYKPGLGLVQIIGDAAGRESYQTNAARKQIEKDE